MLQKINSKEVFGAAMVLLFFLTAVYLSGLYGEQLHAVVGLGGYVGMFAYVGITIVAVVIAPVSTLPLLPVAVSLWGSLAGALLSIVGWTIGGVIAYQLSRRYGRPFVQKFVNIQKAQRIGEMVTGKNPFWTVVLLRAVVPVDVLSYALGLFVDMPLGLYTLATLVGVTPFAFVFSYATTLPFFYQIGVIVTVIIIAITVLIRIHNIAQARVD